MIVLVMSGNGMFLGIVVEVILGIWLMRGMGRVIFLFWFGVLIREVLFMIMEMYIVVGKFFCLLLVFIDDGCDSDEDFVWYFY